MSWMNSDGLYVKFAGERGVSAAGGEYQNYGGQHVYEVVINYNEVGLSTALVDNLGGPFGVMIPKGLFIDEVQIIAEAAFTSSGTIGTSTFVLGLQREDRSTELDYDGLTTTSFTGGSIDSAGETTVIRKGSTGAGALIGTTLANDGLVTVSNSQHASHPFTAGKAVVRVVGHYPITVA